jgi:hypothetical protein
MTARACVCQRCRDLQEFIRSTHSRLHELMRGPSVECECCWDPEVHRAIACTHDWFCLLDGVVNRDREDEQRKQLQ